jgi:hypothetical protein
MADNKLKPSNGDLDAFLDAIPDAGRRADARALIALMERATGEPPLLWEYGIIGFGRYHYRYDSGREGEAGVAGFAPRKNELVVYLPADPPDKEALLARLGKHKAGKCCLYIRRLANVDEQVLEQLVGGAAQAIKKRYPD